MIGLDILKKLFGSQNERTLKKLRPIVEKINALEPTVSALQDAELRAKTAAKIAKLRALRLAKEQADKDAAGSKPPEARPNPSSVWMT